MSVSQHNRFLSTPSARRATVPAVTAADAHKYFYPRPPRGGRPFRVPFHLFHLFYFYPRPPRGGRHPATGLCPDTQTISIHALREEGDLPAIASLSAKNLFLSTPSARRATSTRSWASATSGFLSTPSARRATPPWMKLPCRISHFYPRPPRGGRLQNWATRAAWKNFYPRPPRGGRPGIYFMALGAMADFYPRPPRGGRPLYRVVL